MNVRSIILAVVGAGSVALAQGKITLQEQTIVRARQLIEPQLTRYCGESCQLLDLSADVDESVDEFTELGFEGATDQPVRYVVKQLTARIQIDANITQENRTRLETILNNQLRSLALAASVQWQTVEIPQIGERLGSSAQLEKQLESELEAAVQRAVQAFCPNKCLLAYVGVKGRAIKADEASAYQKNQIVRDADGKNFMKIDSAKIEMTIDQSLGEDARQKISNLIDAATRFASPVSISVAMAAFPETYSEALKKQDDPYGLEKLRQMLIMFRDLAGTKEIITNSSSSTSSDNRTVENSKQSETSTNKSALIDSKESSTTQGEVDWIMWGAIALGVILAGFLAIRLAGANRDAKVMISSVPGEGFANKPGRGGEVSGEQKLVTTEKPATTHAGDISMRLKVEQLKDELTGQFMHEPKVAKETFGRMLKEDGVELTAKYLQIFGHMIVLELIEDPNVSRDLYALSEYFNKSRIELTLDEELKLLQSLKARQTASEIKVMTSKGSDKFAFLEKLDAAQIFTLINEEKSQVQGIVLTQLDKKRRMSVFDMYQGSMRVQLMNELCRADAIPKEFLANVAKALQKKVASRPEFDTENLRSSEIIIDLLERSSLDEQRQIMGHLQRTNADTARGIMLKLVTVEILPYLKDGHLLEIILGLERDDLMLFLAGTADHIKNLFMTKAPYELVESWLEELNQMGLVEENNYKLVELKVFNKIRNLGNSGVINILDINEMIYAPEHHRSVEEQPGKMSSYAVVA